VHERGAAATRHFVLYGFCDEATPIALELIDFLEEIGRQRDGDSLGSHVYSMTQSMIILNETPQGPGLGETAENATTPPHRRVDIAALTLSA
ncbi:MAG: hypothetical protein HY657_17805, partial [Acidobacteria bacterium]|nr:hypothetical protein [Acidobacteriota bacterium]